jgi:glycosyltransferase involved in cell wall biosynthesis
MSEINSKKNIKNMLKDKPLVSIYTPVYNAEKYIRECVDSVLNQTYTHWEYIIVNNQSTDNTLDILNEYAARDSRIRISSNEKFLEQIQNWNSGLNKISPHSKYCKIIHADDWLYPECIEKMVEVGENNPHVGIIGSYRLDENQVNLDGLDHNMTVVSGKEICRLYLLNKLYVFGSPSSLLLRTKVIKDNKPFYDEGEAHPDIFICLKILADWDFGFVHQVLTYTRRHNESMTSFIKSFDTRIIERMKTLEIFGVLYLEASELKQRKKKLFNSYHRFLAKKIYELKELSYWKYHHKELMNAGIKISWGKVATCFLLQLLRPEDTYPHLREGFRKIFSRTKPLNNKQEHQL